MNPHIRQLIQISRELVSVDPVLARQLEMNAIAASRLATPNPGAKTFQDHVEKMVAVLKSLKQELETGLSDLKSDDASEFAKFFADVVDAEEEQLRSSLQRTKALKTAARVASMNFAGPLDFVKNLFKKKPDDEDQGGISPSYTMDESTVDDFVEGKRDWADASHYIDQEFKENNEFFDGVDDVLKELDAAKKKPSRKIIETIKKKVEQLIKFGDKLLNGVRKHLLEPVPKVEITEDGMNKPGHAPSKMAPERLENTVEHYTDMLKESLGDEKKTIKFLKELFSAVGPLIEEDRATLASKRILSTLVRTAHSVPKTRPLLVPIINKIMLASTTPLSSLPGRGSTSR